LSASAIEPILIHCPTTAFVKAPVAATVPVRAVITTSPEKAIAVDQADASPPAISASCEPFAAPFILLCAATV
jgi:hypothetical protein